MTSIVAYYNVIKIAFGIGILGFLIILLPRSIFLWYRIHRFQKQNNNNYEDVEISITLGKISNIIYAMVMAIIAFCYPIFFGYENVPRLYWEILYSRLLPYIITILIIMILIGFYLNRKSKLRIIRLKEDQDVAERKFSKEVKKMMKLAEELINVNSFLVLFSAGPIALMIIGIILFFLFFAFYPGI